MTVFRIFFSYQSNLPMNKTTAFIDECLDRVTDQFGDRVQIIIDRATRGEVGSIDITSTLFSKIDNCDLFVADVSIINPVNKADELAAQQGQEVTHTPNPNVLLETGYAARVIGWERVLCLYNKEYGSPSDYPFDINHHRLTGYQINAGNRSNEAARITSIISETVIKYLYAGGISRQGRAYHQVGGYNPSTYRVEKDIIPYSIADGDAYRFLHEESTHNARYAFDEIKGIQLDHFQETTADGANTTPRLHISMNWQPERRVFSEKEQSDLSKRIFEYLHETVDDEFFNLGNLMETKSLIGNSPSHEGTKDELRKWDLIELLDHELNMLSILDVFQHSFDDLMVIPLAIHNDSNEADSNLTIRVVIVDDSVECVRPDRTVFNAEYADDESRSTVEGIVCELGLIEKLLCMPEDAHICYLEKPTGYDFESTVLPGLPAKAYDDEDYEIELQCFVQDTLGYNTYAYTIEKIRPRETLWLGPVMLLHKKADPVRLRYSILSDNTNGDLQGELVILSI